MLVLSYLCLWLICSSVFTASIIAEWRSVIFILLRYDYGSMGMTFVSQIHTLESGGRELACLLVFLVLKD